MLIVQPYQKICVECNSFLEPVVFADPDINPKQTGNPWKCNKCGKMYGVKDEMTYSEHIEMIKKYYMKENK